MIAAIHFWHHWPTGLMSADEFPLPHPMSSAAALPAARRRGQGVAHRYSRRTPRDAAGARHRGASHRPAGRAGVLELLPLRRRRKQRGRLLHEEMRRCGSLIMRAADQQQSCRQAARSPSTVTVRRSDRGGARRREADRDPPRGSHRPAAGGLAERNRRHRPPHLAALSQGGAASDRRGCAGLLRRHRADRPPRDDRQWTRRGSSRATTRRVRAAATPTTSLPARQGAVHRLHQGAARRREDRLQGLGELDALFRGLPADRGDGVARPRHAALRSDEAGRPHRQANRQPSLCRRPTAGRTTRSARSYNIVGFRPS